MFLFWICLFSSVLLFCPVCGKWQVLQKLFFSKFLQYLTYFLILSGTNFITNMEPASEKKKDIIY